MMRLYYHDDLVAAAHDFDTTRKPRWIVEALEALPVEGVRLVDAEAASDARLRRVHSAGYVEAVRAGQPRDLAESQGFVWDENLYVAAATSAGATAQAARAALEDGVAGALSTGLHHAAPGHGAGFCTFNGLALATVEALDAGVGSVLILDLDAHCGGGTHAIVGGLSGVTQVDVSVSGFDHYDPAPGNTLDLVTDADAYLSTIESRLDEIAGRRPAPGLVLYNAGMDPWEGSPGGLRRISPLILQARETLVFEWARRLGAPIAFVPAGGYTHSDGDHFGIVSLHRQTIDAAARAKTGVP
jgi:acetoin utilization deacetylase AcuC-like enzyme